MTKNASTCRRHRGQLLSRPKHDRQTHVCRHGKRTQLAVRLRHTAHSGKVADRLPQQDELAYGDGAELSLCRLTGDDWEDLPVAARRTVAASLPVVSFTTVRQLWTTATLSRVGCLNSDDRPVVRMTLDDDDAASPDLTVMLSSAGEG